MEKFARLRERQEFALNDRDEARRSMAMGGMPFDEDAGTARLRRYESGIRRALARAQAELQRVREEAALGREAQQAGDTRPLEPLMSEAAVRYQVERFLGGTTIGARPVAEDEVEVQDEDEVVVPTAAPDPDPAAARGGERPLAVVPVVARAAGVFPASASACTAAHRSAAPRRGTGSSNGPRSRRSARRRDSRPRGAEARARSAHHGVGRG